MLFFAVADGRKRGSPDARGRAATKTRLRVLKALRAGSRYRHAQQRHRLGLPRCYYGCVCSTAFLPQPYRALDFRLRCRSGRGLRRGRRRSLRVLSVETRGPAEQRKVARRCVVGPIGGPGACGRVTRGDAHTKHSRVDSYRVLDDDCLYSHDRIRVGRSAPDVRERCVRAYSKSWVSFPSSPYRRHFCFRERFEASTQLPGRAPS